MDGETDLWMRDQNKYKLKVGLALNDIGGMTYQKGGASNNFNINVGLFDLQKFDDTQGFRSLDSTLQSFSDSNFVTFDNIVRDQWKNPSYPLQHFIKCDRIAKVDRLAEGLRVDSATKKALRTWRHEYATVFSEVERVRHMARGSTSAEITAENLEVARVIDDIRSRAGSGIGTANKLKKKKLLCPLKQKYSGPHK